MDPQMIEKMSQVDWNEYEMTIELNKVVGEKNTGSVVINRSDFALIMVQHSVVGDDGTDPMQYSIDVSEQNTYRRWKGANAPMALTLGSPRTSIWKEFRKPWALKKNTTMYVELTNRYAADLDANIKVQILLCGYELREQRG
jgi:hypothetical protein